MSWWVLEGSYFVCICFQLTLFILFLREFKLGEVGNLQKRQGLEGIILEFDVLDMGPSYLRKKKGN
jgi:hypothetical protein